MYREREIVNMDLPREDDKIMSGYFGLVAIWVTHPLCPRRVPLSCRVSDILRQFECCLVTGSIGFDPVDRPQRGVEQKRHTGNSGGEATRQSLQWGILGGEKNINPRFHRCSYRKSLSNCIG